MNIIVRIINFFQRIFSFNRETTLFEGGFSSLAGQYQWANRFGVFSGDSKNIFCSDGEVVIDYCKNVTQGKKHAEAQLKGLVGTDFTYSATITFGRGVDVHLQFRISDEGRYGIRLGNEGITLYCFRRKDIRCDPTDPTIISHCPNWPDDCRKLPLQEGQLPFPDNPEWVELRHDTRNLSAGIKYKLKVKVEGSLFYMFLNEEPIFEQPFEDHSFAVGRFGLYVWGDDSALSTAVFSDIKIIADTRLRSNFALLYSTVGYELNGTKRALLRTLNDLPSGHFYAENTSFVLTRSDGLIMKRGRLNASPGSDNSAMPTSKTFGMQLWEADFSEINTEGLYSLRVEFGTSSETHVFQSEPFEIRSKLITHNNLKPLSILNGEARRAADEDFWRNWIRESGHWSVALDGAFLAHKANAEEGALLRRIFNLNNAVLTMKDFRYVARITIISGCDAQMQFRITPAHRWAVTLQAGESGGCTFGAGPGAIRLHEEGPMVQERNHFRIHATKIFPLTGAEHNPVLRSFEANKPYDIEIEVINDHVTVYVGGYAQLENIYIGDTAAGEAGGFALKAWASTVRFERAQAWEHEAEIYFQSPDGLRIPRFEGQSAWDVAMKYHMDPALKKDKDAKLAEIDNKCQPRFSQWTGFHDCNNYIGEATSHGAFLDSLMAIWQRRAHTFTQIEREELRKIILTNVLYLETLFQQGNAKGEFAHSEIGRGGIYTNLGPYQNEAALYGMSAFADQGVFVDHTLARLAYDRSVKAVELRWPGGEINYPELQSVVFTRLARTAAREGFSPNHKCGKTYWELAFEAVDAVFVKFEKPLGIADEPRDSGRIIPWFEGIYEALQSYPDTAEHPGRDRTSIYIKRKISGYTERLNKIAETLLLHLTAEHPCRDNSDVFKRCTENGFHVLPQASGGIAGLNLPRANWENTVRVPWVNRSAELPFVHFYEANAFSVAASDTIFLGKMTGLKNLERIASGNFYWTLGLNPGIPTSKVIERTRASTPWRATSFIYNSPTSFARTMEGNRMNASSAKGWIADWEGWRNPQNPRQIIAASPHRECWWIDPQNRSVSPPGRSFQTIVNGHVIWDEQWDYWNNGRAGWLSGETFLRNDATFLKAAMLYEDWLSPEQSPSNPYETSRLHFFDTIHLDRKHTGWGFDDPDRSAFAFASRAAHEFCVGKGFKSGRFTGHIIGERIGLWAIPANATFFDATDPEIQATGWGFGDINQTHWAQIARAATAFSTRKGFAAGFFTGHQLNGKRGIICLDNSMVSWFDANMQDISGSGEAFNDINEVPWAKAARAASNICLNKGFFGGFFTGHQVAGKIGVVGFIK